MKNKAPPIAECTAGSASGSRYVLPGLTMPAGHHAHALQNKEDVEQEVEKAYIQASCLPRGWARAMVLDQPVCRARVQRCPSYPCHWRQNWTLAMLLDLVLVKGFAC